ncbi:hypothetical protein KSP39_PZI023520 [Platanthera zijinensis]|uniref:RNase H type-1 domain-containing protein n=1 Tax=Platanthera zijinensis TaxID=2320716 RepID=A0AAP0FTX4_9ASPA
MGLDLVRRFLHDTTGIIMEGDSSEACTRLNRILAGAAIGDVEASLSKILLEAPRVIISLVDREANKAADHVARIAADYDFVWERGMPQSQDFLSIIHHDYAL